MGNRVTRPSVRGWLLYRVVGLGRLSDTQTDFVQDNTAFIAPSFTWRPTADTTFTILSQYQKIKNSGYQQYIPAQVSFLANPNGFIPIGRYLGEPGPDGFNLEEAAIGYAFEHHFNNYLQFRQNLRYLEVSNDLSSVRSEGMVGNSSTLVARTYNYVKARASNLAVDNQLQADFATGPPPQSPAWIGPLRSQGRHRLQIGRHRTHRRLQPGLWLADPFL